MSGKASPGGTILQLLAFDVSGGEKDSDPVAIPLRLGEGRSFQLSVSGDTVSVRLGDRMKSLRRHIVDPVVSVICSTGEFLFTDLTITATL